MWASATNVYHIQNGLQMIWKDEAIASTFSALRKWEIIMGMRIVLKTSLCNLSLFCITV